MSSRTRLLALLLGVFGSSVQAADIANGSRLYTANCIACHGGPGIAAAPNSPSFERGQGMMKPDFILVERTRVGKNGHPSFQGRLSDGDILDMIAYLRTLH